MLIQAHANVMLQGGVGGVASAALAAVVAANNCASGQGMGARTDHATTTCISERFRAPCEKASGGFRASNTGVSGGFRGFPRVSAIRQANKRFTALGKTYDSANGEKGFLRLNRALI